MPGKLTQVEAAKIMFAHSKVVSARAREAGLGYRNKEYSEPAAFQNALTRAFRERIHAEATFEQIVAELTDSTGL